MTQSEFEKLLKRTPRFTIYDSIWSDSEVELYNHENNHLTENQKSRVIAFIARMAREIDKVKGKK